MNTTLDKARFRRLWSRCVVAGADAGADDLYEELAAYYREPHRFYHTGGHINDCLSRMDLAAPELGQSDTVELAIWFHDVIYQPGDRENERLSADWFVKKAAGLLAPEMVLEVEGYIMDTRHQTMPVAEGAKFVVDVDLSGFGMSSEPFYEDGENIRKEFPDMSDAEFNRGQSGFLQSLLDRDRIYSTPFFYNLCEATARRNIIDLLKRHADPI